MDEDAIFIVQRPRAQRHDKWSVLIRLSNLGLNVSRAGSLFMDQMTDMLIEHSMQLDIDRGFKEVIDGNPSFGTREVQQED